MSRSLNKVTLIGNLGNDPEVRSTTGGNRVATFSLATSRQWNSPNGEKQEKTEWHRCVAWNSNYSKLADVVTCRTPVPSLRMTKMSGTPDIAPMLVANTIERPSGE